MTFTTKNWKNKPDLSTPINAAALVDMEARLAGYTDSSVAGLGGGGGSGNIIYTEPGDPPPSAGSYAAGTLWVEITE